MYVVFETAGIFYFGGFLDCSRSKFFSGYLDQICLKFPLESSEIPKRNIFFSFILSTAIVKFNIDWKPSWARSYKITQFVSTSFDPIVKLYVKFKNVQKMTSFWATKRFLFFERKTLFLSSNFSARNHRIYLDLCIFLQDVKCLMNRANFCSKTYVIYDKSVVFSENASNHSWSFRGFSHKQNWTFYYFL